MAIGTAMAIGMGISAATQLYGAKKASDASKKAASQQVGAADEASKYIQQGMGTLGQLYAPYVNAGAGAMGTLGRLTAAPPGSRYAAPAPADVMPRMSSPDGATAPPPSNGRMSKEWQGAIDGSGFGVGLIGGMAGRAANAGSVVGPMGGGPRQPIFDAPYGGGGPGATGAARVEPQSMRQPPMRAMGGPGNGATGAGRVDPQSMNVGTFGRMAMQEAPEMIEFQSPDGSEVRAFPAHLAEKLIAAGARPVGRR